MGHIAPEAVDGGPIAFVRDGDPIVLDVLNRTLEVEVDEDLLARVIENVLDNGMRYTPAGGRLRVDGAASDGQVELRIANTGPAIPAAVRRVVFEKFGQATQATGRMNLGLGLYFCRLAMEAHGGRIWVDEAPQFPTVFDLAFGDAPPQR